MASLKESYNSWHENPHHPHLHWSAFVAVSLLMASFLIGQINKLDDESVAYLFEIKKVQAAGENDYFDSLIARPDFWKGYSFRPQPGTACGATDPNGAGPLTAVTAGLCNPYYEKQLGYAITDGG